MYTHLLIFQLRSDQLHSTTSLEAWLSSKDPTLQTQTAVLRLSVCSCLNENDIQREHNSHTKLYEIKSINIFKEKIEFSE